MRAVRKLYNSINTRYSTNRSRIKQFRTRNQHKNCLPLLHPFENNILHGLKLDGGVITSLAELYSEGITSNFDIDTARKIAANPQTSGESNKEYLISASLEQLTSAPHLIKWGLEERLLAIAQNYFGMPVAYRGLILRRDFADGKYVETRQWHKDAEDTRILKIIIYLNDVDENGGAFRFLPRAQTPKKRIKLINGRVPENIMNKIVSSDKYVTCVGPTGTVIFADTVNVWHHGCVPKDTDRLTAFFAYNSHLPLRPQYCQPLFPKSCLDSEKLTGKQSSAIKYSYQVEQPEDKALTF